ncbi:septation regulator SpoVG [bacterium]|nr:septation regulator SpoVG [bacterium]MBU1881391.1 septation regulator SpoVG [bacterium]
MELTEININLRDEDKLKAFVNITFDDVFVVRGLKVIQGNKGLFVCMPSRKLGDGTYKDIAHPINNEFRQTIEQMILQKYEKVLEDPDLQGIPDPVIE